MASQLRLESHQLSDLLTVAQNGAAKLAEVVKAISELSVQPLHPSELEEALKDTNLFDSEYLGSVLGLAIPLASLSRQFGPEEILQGLRFGVQNPDNHQASPKDLDAWLSVEPEFGKLLSLDRLVTVSKALDLSYDYANLFQSARIVTDIRPVFSEAADKVLGAVVSYTLRMRYTSADGLHTISVALDEADVLNLHEQCARSLQKAEVAKELMESKSGTRTIIVGE